MLSRKRNPGQRAQPALPQKKNAVIKGWNTGTTGRPVLFS
jgi:hypothetical protein